MRELIFAISCIVALVFTLFVSTETLRKRYSLLALIFQGKLKEAYGFPAKDEKNLKLTLRKSLRVALRIFLGIWFELVLIAEAVLFFYGSPLLIIIAIVGLFLSELIYLLKISRGEPRKLFASAEIYMYKDEKGRDKHIVNYPSFDSKSLEGASEVSFYGIMLTMMALLLVFACTRSTMETTVEQKYVINDVISIPASEDDGNTESNKLYYFNCTDEAGNTFTILLDESEVECIVPDSKQADSYLTITETTVYKKSDIYINAEYKEFSEETTYKFSLISGETLKSIDEIIQ